MTEGNISSLTAPKLQPLLAYLYQRVQALETSQNEWKATETELRGKLVLLEAMLNEKAEKSALKSSSQKNHNKPASYANAVGITPSTSNVPKSSSTMQSQRRSDNIILEETETTFKVVEHRKKPLVRGSVATTAADKSEAFKKLRLSQPPGRDFLVKGIPKDATADDIKNHLDENGIKTRFVSLNAIKKDDHRSTTSARIGTTPEFEEQILNVNIWPCHVFIRPWNYDRQTASKQAAPGNLQLRKLQR